MYTCKDDFASETELNPFSTNVPLLYSRRHQVGYRSGTLVENELTHTVTCCNTMKHVGGKHVIPTHNLKPRKYIKPNLDYVLKGS